jgi:hypothetical protein
MLKKKRQANLVKARKFHVSGETIKILSAARLEDVQGASGSICDTIHTKGSGICQTN